MSETNQELSGKYYTRTQSAISELSGHLESIRKGSRPQDDAEKAATEIARLRRDYADAISFLPTYDQRQFDKQLKDLERAVEQIRASAPKTKFAFKRNAGKTSSSSAPTLPLSTPHTTSTPSSLTSTDQASRTDAEPPSSGLSIASHSHKYLTISSLSSPRTSAMDLTISDLNHCVVNLVATAGTQPELTFTALHARNLSDTVLVLPVIEGSALLHDMKNCVIALESRQFRMHTSSQVDVYISISSNPIIEHSSAIRFADYPLFLRRPSGTDHDHTKAIMKSNYLAVQDFTHIRASPSPNWSALPEDATIPEDRWPSAAIEDVGVVLQLLPSQHP